MDDVYDFGKRLKELREAKGLTQTQVANRLRLSRSLLSAYESNTKAPKYNTLKAIALMYDTTPNYILNFHYEYIIPADGITEEQMHMLMKNNREYVDALRKANAK